MKRLILVLAAALVCCGAFAQQVYSLPAPPSDVEETVTYGPEGQVLTYANVTRPAIEVMLPDPAVATGAAVLVYPGGSMVTLTWEGEFKTIARYLNERGIAAIGVKYRTRPSGPRAQAQPAPQPRPQGQPAQRPAAPPRRDITTFTNLVKANCGPGGDVSYMAPAAEDSRNAFRFVRDHAADWGIDPERIGMMGFSAGGCTLLAGFKETDPSEYPAFIASIYGPSTMELDVPADAPKLFVAVHADHPSVAAGCLALFMEWKKAGVDAEIHIYGDNTGGLYGGRPGQDHPTKNGSWMESFYSWMVANGWAQDRS